MIRKPSNTSNQNKTRGRGRRLLAAALLPAATAATLLTASGTASASTPLLLSATSECGANGTVIADKPTTYNNGQLVHWTPILEVWANGAWQYAGIGPMQSGTESGPGAVDIGSWAVAISPWYFHAQPGHYYVVIDAITVGTTSANYYAWPIEGRVGSNYYCYTG